MPRLGGQLRVVYAVSIRIVDSGTHPACQRRFIGTRTLQTQAGKRRGVQGTAHRFELLCLRIHSAEVNP